MCGIIGYIGSRNVTPILIKGLKRLEYRGYDSCGIATINNKELKVVKTKGKIENLESKIDKNYFSNIGIAHTRWATHGIPNENNAHPHIDCNNEIAIVHNGIIENYTTLKKYLEDKGHKFKTKTDSEIIAHLIEEFYKSDKNFLNAIKKALSKIIGSYGLAIINKNINKIYVARKGSPIVIGIGENEYFIASDISAIIEYTKDTIFLEDEEIIEISSKSKKIETLKDNKEIKKEIKKIELNLKEIEKGKYKYFMEKEIFEQPSTIRNALSGRIDFKNINVILGGISFHKKDDLFYKNLKKIIILACGTSYHCGLVIKYLMEKHLRIPVVVEIASEFRYKNPIIDKNTLTIPISQSGETADTIGALKIAKDKGSNLIGIVNKVASTIGRECSKGIHIRAGAEIGVASTKAFTNQLIALYLLTIHIGKINGTINDETAQNFINNLTRIPNLIEDTLKNNLKIKNICKKYIDYNNVIYLARGINYPIALEGALKLKEITYVNAQAYPAGELKHGPLAVVDNNSLCIVIANNNFEYSKIKSTINEIKSRNGKVLCITNYENTELANEVDEIIYISKIDYDFEVFLNVIIFQLIAYNWGILKGCDIDKPRNLAKSVTVE